MMLLAIYYH